MDGFSHGQVGFFQECFQSTGDAKWIVDVQGPSSKAVGELLVSRDPGHCQGMVHSIPNTSDPNGDF